jgi:two-component system sensor histidine kinase YesM
MRLGVILIASSLLPLLLLGMATFFSIQSIFQLKIEGGIRNTLSQTRIGFENMLSNMEYASEQLTFEGNIGEKMYKLLNTESIFDQMQIDKEIEQNINLVNFTNPYLGVMFYCFSDTGQIKFQNAAIKTDFTIEGREPFGNIKGSTFYGPHTTAHNYRDNVVFSLLRPIYASGLDGERIYIYIETNLKLLEDLFNREQYGMEANYIVLNQNNEVVLSDLPEQFPIGKQDPLRSTGDRFFIFTDKSDQGWSIAVAIKRTQFYKEFYDWLLEYGLIVVICLLASNLLAVLIWKNVYLPLVKIQRNIASLSKNNLHYPIRPLGIREFDSVLNEFQRARNKIVDLMHEVEQNERTKAQVEVEKLLYQINPHFIYNTLNSIQWLARMEGQTKVVSLVSIFSRLLHYNLGKEGDTVPLAKELEALKDYISLQSIRYNHSFLVEFSIDDRLLDVKVPRFILQPLAENALYHGIGVDYQNGVIEVFIQQIQSEMVIQVRDNGAGMTPEELRRLMDAKSNEQRKTGLGIGLNYVYRVLKAHYGENCSFAIDSQVGEGTTITIRIQLAP